MIFIVSRIMWSVIKVHQNKGFDPCCKLIKLNGIQIKLFQF